MAIRQRKNTHTTEEREFKSQKSPPEERHPKQSTTLPLKDDNNRKRFRVAKWLILRLMAFIYLMGFAASWYQNEGLMGSHGLQPAASFMSRLQQQEELMGGVGDSRSNKWKGFVQNPTIFWWISLTDNHMNNVSLTGMILSAIAMMGVNSWLLQFVLWILYFSLVTIAGATSFYAYGWESQILETGFLCIFLCKIPSVFLDKQRMLPQLHLALVEMKESPPTFAILWLFQWLIFRISIGAGLIKLRGSSCWTRKTCLYYHFETQPIPSPLSFVYHFLPRFIHRRMVDVDLVVQLYTVWFVLFPHVLRDKYTKRIVRLGGFLQVGLMIGILLSGNFSVLNHLTIIPALACLDDACWPKWLQTACTRRHHLEQVNQPKVRFDRRIVDVVLLSVILWLSRPVIYNLLQLENNRQMMNASFDPFRLVNTYGAFGSVGEARYEPIVKVSDDQEEWTELEFPCKPGSLRRRPCFCAPYHYRLAWNIWFIGFKPHQSYLRRREQWLFVLCRKLLDPGIGQRPWLALLDPSSSKFLELTYYRHQSAPKYIKVDIYHYQMAAPLWEIISNKNEVWWNRTFEEPLIPPVSLEAFQPR